MIFFPHDGIIRKKIMVLGNTFLCGCGCASPWYDQTAVEAANHTTVGVELKSIPLRSLTAGY